MTSVPNLYLKWSVFRTLLRPARSDRQVARTIFGSFFGVERTTPMRPIGQFFSQKCSGVSMAFSPEIAGEPRRASLTGGRARTQAPATPLKLQQSICIR
jgi:hypothetical protein